MIRILHAADLHLDSPFQALGRDKARQRRSEQRELLRRIADAAREHSADIALFAGDLFDSADVFSDTGKVLAEVLSGMDIPVLIAPGNHDYYSSRSVWPRLNLGENVHVFKDGQISCVEFPELGARIWGSAFTDRRRTSPLSGFEAEKSGDILDVMVLHGEVGNPASAYGPISEEELARSGMDYVALGHIHTFSGLRRAGETYYAWPGCPEGRGFDETGTKGVLLVELSEESCSAHFLPIAGRRYEAAWVDLSKAENAAETAAQVLPDTGGRDVYRIYLTGETDAAPDTDAIARALDGRFFSLELIDKTALRRDIWAGRSGGSLKGLYLSRLWSMLEAEEDDSARERITRAAKYGLAAMENGEEPPL